jgi:fatty acid desaturase
MSFTMRVQDMKVIEPAWGRSTSSRQVEWPTVAIGLVIFGGWLAVTRYHQHLPSALTVLLLGWLLAWSSSYQHELLHGHPTPWRWLNDGIGRLTLELWLPYDHYKRTHLRHHRDEHLTDPVDDPESYYVSPDQWNETGAILRALLTANRTLVGRLTVGPWLTVSAYLIGQVNELLAGEGKPGEGDPRSRWGVHLPYLAATVGWLALNHVSWWQYGVAMWISQSLIKLRSFIEHRWTLNDAGRSAMVASRGPLALLFLNNNLHHAHHTRVSVPWYSLPAYAHSSDAMTAAASGAGTYSGYLAVLRQFAFRPIDGAVHPAPNSNGSTSAVPVPSAVND